MPLFEPDGTEPPFRLKCDAVNFHPGPGREMRGAIDCGGSSERYAIEVAVMGEEDRLVLCPVQCTLICVRLVDRLFFASSSRLSVQFEVVITEGAI